MKFVFLDFETFYASDYSLRGMDPPSYILDERFEAICLGVAEGFTDKPYLVDGPDIPQFLQRLGTDVAVVTHNALFDMCILAWRFNYVPSFMADTLGMSRTLLGHRLRKLSLASVGEYYGLTKGDTISKVAGMGRADIIAAEMWPEYTGYCLNDTDICRTIFAKLAPYLPAEEFVLHDMILRTAVEPQFRVDQEVLAEHAGTIEHDKSKLFMKAMFAGLTDKAELMSNDQLAELLIRLGVDPPRKISKTTGRSTYAFSKQDPAFLQLLEHDDPRVIAIIEARLAFKTTIEQTRTARMINIGNLTFPGKGQGWMPIPLKIGAAVTHRLGGDWKLNPQNWGRKSPIRRAVVAPEGHKVVAADSEQIEARMNGWFCGEQELTAQFAKGEDVYASFASEVFRVPVTKATEPAKRFIGKTGILQLGYQSGWQKFQSSVWLQSYNSEPEPIALDDAMAQSIVTGYREKYWRIEQMWQTLRDVIPTMAQAPNQRTEHTSKIGPITFGGNRLIGPNKLVMNYHNLRYEGQQWIYDYGSIPYKLYGGKLLENIIQFLARIAVMQAAIRLKKVLLPFSSRLTHTAHDEIVYIVPDKHVGEVSELIRAEMSKSPDWAPGLPLSVAIGVGQNYGECK
jgi:DNA polymerase I-like protein with 3'-5' exonuclease and polymerase domains